MGQDHDNTYVYVLSWSRLLGYAVHTKLDYNTELKERLFIYLVHSMLIPSEYFLFSQFYPILPREG